MSDNQEPGTKSSDLTAVAGPETVRMADVARAAGVSVATVSRVINNNNRTSIEVRRKVLAAVAHLNYRPNRAAQTLRGRSSTLIGVVVPDIANPFFMALVRGCEDVAETLGMSVIVASTDENADKERRKIEAMIDHGVRCIVLAPALEGTDPTELFAMHKVQCVLVDRDLPSSRYPAVLNADQGAIRDVISVLVSSGHRDIAVVAGPQGSYTGRVRLEAACSAMRDLGLDLPGERVVIGDFMDGHGYGGVLNLLQSNRPPTSFLACSNIILESVIRAARLLRLNIPNDVSVAGLADRSLVDLIEPPMVVAQQDPQTIGHVAIQLMFDSTTTVRGERRRVFIPAPLVSGASVKNLAVLGSRR